MKYNFKNVVHVNTDRMGRFDDQWIGVGFVNYSKEGDRKYISFDEAEELYIKGLTDENLRKNDDGKLYLSSSFCSAETAFNIFNGILLQDVKEESLELVKYCKNHGLLFDSPIEINMKVGVKNLEIIGDKYIFKYRLKDEYLKCCNIRGVERVCVGAVKKIANSTYTEGGRSGKFTKKYDFKCDSVNFNSSIGELSVTVDRMNANKKILHDCIRGLDLQFFISLGDHNKYSLIHAAMDIVKNEGQFHWIGLPFGEESEKKSDVYWFDKELPDYGGIQD